VHFKLSCFLNYYTPWFRIKALQAKSRIFPKLVKLSAEFTVTSSSISIQSFHWDFLSDEIMLPPRAERTLLCLYPRRHVAIRACFHAKAIDVEYKAAFAPSAACPLFDLQCFILPPIDWLFLIASRCSLLGYCVPQANGMVWESTVVRLCFRRHMGHEFPAARYRSRKFLGIRM
jgi:hypothetical protein